MTPMKRYLLTTPILLLFWAMSYVQADTVNVAQDENLGEWFDTRQNNAHAYVGLRGGWTNVEGACSSDSSVCNDDTFGYGLYAGYQFTSWFALEAAVTDYGSPDASYGVNNVSADIWGSELSGVFSYDVSEHLDAYLRVGAAYQGIDKESTWGDAQTSNEWGIVSAVGLDYRLSKNWSLRGEYQFIDGIGDEEVMQADMHFVSLGLSYHFGQKRQFIAAPIPEMVEPVVEWVLVTTQVSLKPSATFNFDSSIIKASAQLTALITQLQLSSEGSIEITGHTDSSGSAKYNQWLSERRANAIADHLIQNGISSSRITAIGKGESSPAASNETAEGRAENRRVDITFEKTITEEVSNETSINSGNEQ
ncbi:OmpA family protein [Shewanella sp. YLB-07]|nr:OmpA family protein [Shewanella sp. YLB-07]